MNPWSALLNEGMLAQGKGIGNGGEHVTLSKKFSRHGQQEIRQKLANDPRRKITQKFPRFHGHGTRTRGPALGVESGVRTL